jgi:cytochrome c
VAKASGINNIGIAPLKAELSAEGSFDPDNDDTVRYEWRKSPTGSVVSKTKNPTIQFDENGIYNVELSVIDDAGARARAQVPVLVGNSPAQIKIESPPPNSFFTWQENLPVRVSVEDPEDDEFLGRIFIKISPEKSLSGQDKLPTGFALMRSSDCMNCHAVRHKIVGPPLLDIAKRYRNNS